VLNIISDFEELFKLKKNFIKSIKLLHSNAIMSSIIYALENVYNESLEKVTQ